MRVALIGKQYPDSLADNLAFSLRCMGHVVVAIDEDRTTGLSWLRDHQTRFHGVIARTPTMHYLRDALVTRAVIRFKPDFVLNTFADWSPQGRAEVRERLGQSVPIVFLYPDPAANLGREYALAGEYDAWFCKDTWAVDLFRSRLGINVHYLPEACNPAWHRPVGLSSADLAAYACDLTLAGNMYYYRARMLEPFTAYHLKVWGSSFPPWLRSPIRQQYPGVYVARVQKAKAFRAAKIVLNLLTYKEGNAANARTFEAAGCGAFQIADWRPAIGELFEPDKEVVFFRSREELLDKVEYYLKHPEDRRRIADAAHRRAYAEHTYQQRLHTMFRLVGFE